jgi:hypothetical protein
LTEDDAVANTDPPTAVYDYTYAYDPLSNRTPKYDAVADRETWYAYDTDFVGEDPNDPNDWRSAFVPWIASASLYPYETRNNRLVEYREYGPAVGDERPLERTVYYTYQNTGHVSHITVKDEGYDTVKDLYLAYGTDEKVGTVIFEE